MSIKGVDLAKKYGRHWIFKDLNFEVEKGRKTAILGKNGSGKSTLIQIIAGYLTPSKGKVLFNGSDFESSDIQTAFIGPYTDIVEEFTLREFLHFHSKFKIPTASVEEMAKSASLPLDKQIMDFSTGMKQRAKLLTVFYFENDLVCMDEPTSNLDEEGFEWWKNMFNAASGKFFFVASNEKSEIALCKNRISL